MKPKTNDQGPLITLNVDLLIDLIREKAGEVIREEMHEFRAQVFPVNGKRIRSTAKAPSISSHDAGAEGRTWISLEEAAPQFGMSFEGMKNAVLLGRFPCPTFKLGRRRVIDRDVLDAYFAKKKSEGITKLENGPSTETPKPHRAAIKDWKSGRKRAKT